MEAGPSSVIRSVSSAAPFDHAQLDVSANLTSNHLLQVPPLLAPFCPSLAALHLARARLLLQLPPGSAIGWCHVCGGLREGMGGADRKSPAAWEKAENQTGRRSDMEQKSPTKRRRKGQASSVMTGSRRRPAKCTICGASFRRPKPDAATLAAFPPARRTARTRAAAAAAAAVVPTSSQPESSMKDLGTPSAGTGPAQTAKQPPHLSTTVASILSAVSAPQTIENRSALLSVPVTQSAPPSPPSLGSTGSIGVQAEHPPRPKPLLARPTLSHIPSSDPNPPTWPRPEPPLSAKSTLAASATSASTSGAGAGTGRKKKKMSGLAKLLAERKEREEGEKQGAGRWGLG